MAVLGLASFTPVGHAVELRAPASCTVDDLLEICLLLGFS
jgi:hypothetical protein